MFKIHKNLIKKYSTVCIRGEFSLDMNVPELKGGNNASSTRHVLFHYS